MDNDLRDARVMVTGARGFIGRHLCRVLLQSGAIVLGVSRAVHPHGHVRRMSWTVADMTDLSAVRDAMRSARPDIVYHLAARVTGSQELREVHPTLSHNLASTVHILTVAAEEKPSRVVLTGSMHEPESDVPDAIVCSPYAASKAAGSVYARMFHQLYDVPAVVARPMMVYGPGQRDATKLLPHVISSLLGGTAPALATGARELDWVYVEDVARGLTRLGNAAHVNGRTIDLGSGSLVSVRQLVDRVASLIGANVSATFGAVPERRLERPRVAHVGLARDLLGWSASTSLEAGLRKTISWWKNGAPDDFPGLSNLTDVVGRHDVSLTLRDV